MFKKSERLQKLFNQCEESAVAAHADVNIDFDDVDEYNVVGEYLSGIEKGIELQQKLAGERRTSKNAEIYRCDYNCYADDDGTMLFIGTEDNLAKLFEEIAQKNPAEESDEDRT